MSQNRDDTQSRRHNALSTYLEGLSPRVADDEPLKITTAGRSVLIEGPELQTAVAVGLMMLERAAERGGTTLSLRAIRALRDDLTGSLSSHDVMKLEVEAYDLMSWLVGLEQHAEPVPRPSPDQKHELIAYDPDSPVIELLERAIDEEFDVEMQYYTQSRGQLNTRRVTPLEIQAEKYLHAYCHTRREERVFRISRIAELSPVDGVVVKPPTSEESDDGPAQGSLF